MDYKKTQICFLILMCFVNIEAFCQNERYTIQLKDATLADAMKQLKNKSGYNYIVNNESIDLSIKRDITEVNKTVEEILKSISNIYQINYEFDEKVIIITKKEVKPVQSKNKAELYQTIKGTVNDRDSKMPLVGATVAVMDVSPIIGTITDMDGNYKLTEVPIGRHIIQVKYLGYEDLMIPEILVGSGKEVVLNLQLMESLKNLEGVTITATKGEPKNEMANVSARSFSTEETKRYAASISDPARMALVFAGVATGNDASNEIVIRGNSPNAMLWRLEGVEIPSPNHFAEEGWSAGYVSILSANMVGKSDFYTGAFPADYGNALSGVFDISLRNGNTEKREYTFQAGVLGVDFALEGPYSSHYNGSYLINYRYSTFSILNNLGIKISGDDLPTYQDLSFNFHLPTKKAGNFSFWGIGGLGDAFASAYPDSADWEFTDNRNDDITKTGMYASGITHIYFTDDKSYIKSVISASGNMSEDGQIRLEDDLVTRTKEYTELQKLNYLHFTSMYNRKFNKNMTFRTGFIYSQLYYDFYAAGIIDRSNDEWDTFLDEEDNMGMLQAFSQAKYRLNDEITINGGLHYTQLLLNNSYSIEPRMGISWKFAKNQALAFGYGIHSRNESVSTYFIRIPDNQDGYTQPNKKLELKRASHYVLSYDNSLTSDIHFKMETYYQYLKKLPVPNNPDKILSPMNGYRTNEDTLVSEGNGRNYGVELTLEKYFTKNYYFLITSSLFKSEYQPLNKRWYSTLYDIGYVNNLVGGKEFKLKNNNLIGLNVKLIWSGGKRDTPINYEESDIEGYVIYFTDSLFMIKQPYYLRLDLGISYSINKPKSTHVISFDLQNATNRKNIFYEAYDVEMQKKATMYMAGTIPILNYRIEF
ncbi:MAG: carboxypeptidase-like regulatory domain-containing protein [Bacteroidales bacterium]|nr:carboxypeptidase-like regulatory domain-containing protein [Bacteroidales bacterium]